MEFRMIEYNKSNPLRVVELFAGYGSQRLALERLKRQYSEFDYKVVAIAEVDKYAIKAYEAIHGDCPNLGDVCKIDWTKAPDCDLITWSFPCTSLSFAGLQAGMKEGSGTASSLAWEALKAIKIKRPRFALMENVPSLLSKKFLPDFLKVESTLSNYGYTNFTKILGAQDYGIPQHRDRVFMVSILDKNAHYYFPEPFPLTKRLKDVLEDEVDESYYLSDERVQGLIASTLKQQNKGNGFKFEPKTPEQIATTVQASGCNRKTNNFVVCGAIRGGARIAPKTTSTIWSLK